MVHVKHGNNVVVLVVVLVLVLDVLVVDVLDVLDVLVELLVVVLVVPGTTTSVPCRLQLTILITVPAKLQLKTLMFPTSPQLLYGISSMASASKSQDWFRPE